MTPIRILGIDLLSLLNNNEKKLFLEQLPPYGSKIVVGMSGGVDSSLSAALLVAMGCFEVSGCWMRNWDLSDESPTSIAVCSQDKDFQDATFVANKLNIPIFEKNFSKDYWCSVWEPCLNMYKQGKTPNPDIFCNREIKFGSFLDSFPSNDTFIATGHYARLTPNSKQLCRGLDEAKDQSYFLSGVLPSSIKRACFPIGGMKKTRVKELALSIGLNRIVSKPESQGVCFIGERGNSKFSSFLQEYISIPTNGRFVSVNDGKDLGSVTSILTIGQRARIGGMSEAYFVAKKLSNNDILVAPGINHPALMVNGVKVKFEKLMFIENSFFKDYLNIKSSLLSCQVRYRSHSIPCLISSINENDYSVNIDFYSKTETSVAEGQVLALYWNNICLGGGEIVQVNRPYFS